MKIILLISLFLLAPFFASADVVINEIMYDLDGADKGREWIEIYNGGTEAVDLSGWRFYEGGTNHRIKTVGEGNFIISSGIFAVIADKPENFLADWPDFSGIIFDSSFSLKNSGESLIIKDGELNDIDKVDYLSDWGGDGDGNSLQRDGGNWIAMAPTPGALNAGASQAEEQEEITEEEPAMSEVEEEPIAESAAAGEGEILKPGINSPAGREEPSVSEESESIVEPKIQSVEIKQERLETESLSQKQKNKEQRGKKKTAGYSAADNAQKDFLEDNSVNTKPAQKEEKNIESPSFVIDETAQAANVITAVSDKVRGIEEWLVLVLIIGILAGIGTLFIRG